MKPVIKLLYFDGMQYRWVCRSEWNIGFGETPAKAYEQWLSRNLIMRCE